MPDQRSLQDQLKELRVLANKHGLYDAADYLSLVIDNGRGSVGQGTDSSSPDRDRRNDHRS